MDEEEVVLTLPFREDLVGDPEHETYHGGVLAALTDAAGTFALIAATGHDWVTVDMRVDFLRAAGRGPVTARATTLRAGRRIGFARAELTDAEGRTVALGHLTLAPSDPGGAAGSPTENP